MLPNIKNIKYEGDVTMMSRIGKLETKSSKVKYGVTEDSSTFYIVDTIKDQSGKKIYVCDFWYKENEPYFIIESQVLNYTSFI
jgi:hypothetical protein